jgi:hypothetical protein
MSELMREFLQAWLDWAESDTTLGLPFRKHAGLCTNGSWFVWEHKRAGPVESKAFNKELKGMLKRDGLDTDYPFGQAEYDRDADNDTQHTNGQRLAWVHSKLEAA